MTRAEKPKKNQSKDTADYKEAAERLVVLLAATRHEIELLELRTERLERPRPAFINLAKAIDRKILDVFGISAHSLAHIIPPEVQSLDGIDLGSLSDEQLNAKVHEYDRRFAVTERTAHLRGFKKSIGRGYKVLRSLAMITAKKVLRTYKGARV